MADIKAKIVSKGRIAIFIHAIETSYDVCNVKIHNVKENNVKIITAKVSFNRKTFEGEKEVRYLSYSMEEMKIIRSTMSAEGLNYGL